MTEKPKTVRLTIEVDEHTYTMLKADTLNRTFLGARRLGLSFEEAHWTVEQIAGELLDDVYSPHFENWSKVPY